MPNTGHIFCKSFTKSPYGFPEITCETLYTQCQSPPLDWLVAESPRHGHAAWELEPAPTGSRRSGSLYLALCPVGPDAQAQAQEWGFPVKARGGKRTDPSTRTPPKWRTSPHTPSGLCTPPFSPHKSSRPDPQSAQWLSTRRAHGCLGSKPTLSPQERNLYRCELEQGTLWWTPFRRGFMSTTHFEGGSLSKFMAIFHQRTSNCQTPRQFCTKTSRRVFLETHGTRRKEEEEEKTRRKKRRTNGFSNPKRWRRSGCAAARSLRSSAPWEENEEKTRHPPVVMEPDWAEAQNPALQDLG